MNSKTQSKYGQPSIGCYLDQGNYNNEELSREIIDLAIGYGFVPDADAQTILDSEEELTDDEAETLDQISEEAIDWLNDQETRPFMYWANEGEANAFGLWANVDGAKEDCGFVSGQDGLDTPPADYSGEWLSVSDHGNATLYVRSSDGVDTEIWSIV